MNSCIGAQLFQTAIYLSFRPYDCLVYGICGSTFWVSVEYEPVYPYARYANLYVAVFIGFNHQKSPLFAFLSLPLRASSANSSYSSLALRLSLSNFARSSCDVLSTSSGLNGLTSSR